MIHLLDVSKQYGTVNALHNVNLSFQPHKTTALIGASGCGKSTILRLIAGLENTSSGEIKIDDTPLKHTNLTNYRKTLGYVIQAGGLFPHLTVKRNICIGATQAQWPKGRIKQRLDELMALTRLPENCLDKYPDQLSGGQQQRVNLMRALFMDPERLLLDEPFGALDPIVRYDLQHELKEICQNLKKTVIIVTHDMAEAVYLSDHIVLLNEGKIIQTGVFKDFAEKPNCAFVSTFLKAQRQLPITSTYGVAIK